QITGAVQYTPARTAPRLNLGGNLLVHPEKKLIKPGIVEKSMAHWGGLSLFLGRKTGDNPLG
ncbi:MAG: hypothetical protein PVI28_17840, partial [Gammaproteobacteria bacterium]